MVDITEIVSSNRITKSGYVVSVNNGSLGGIVTITTAANISLVPGVNVTGLTKYFNMYVIVTDAAVNVTLPSTAQVTTGWKCKIMLSSVAGTGVLTILNSLAVTESIMTATSANYNACAEFTLTNTAGALWRTMYRAFNSSAGVLRNLSYDSNNMLREIDLFQGSFFAYSGITSVDINVDYNFPMFIPWEFGYPGRFVDPELFDPLPASNTRISPLRRMTVIIKAEVHFNVTGSAPLDDYICLLRRDGTLTTAFPQSTLYATISITADSIVSITLVTFLLAGSYYELALSYVSGFPPVGTADTVPADTYISVRVISFD